MGDPHHLPTRPAWTCRVCDQPWPCRFAQGLLLAEYDVTPTSLAMYLGVCFAEAADQLPAVPVGDLYQQFFGFFLCRSRRFDDRRRRPAGRPAADA